MTTPRATSDERRGLAAPDDAWLEEVADGVFAYVQPDGGWCLNNAGLVVHDGRAALVDTAATETRARRLREAVRGVTAAPPGVLVNTHFHGDHTFGNFVFPEALVVGHERTRSEALAAGLHLTGLWPEVRWGALELAPPALTYRDGVTLHVGEVRVEVLHPGPAHTTDDSVVWLPDQGVLFTGDIVMSGVTPFCAMGSVSGSLAVLDRLRSLGARTVVPGHGPVAGPELFDVTESYLRWVQETARQGMAAGLSPLEAARACDLGDFAGLRDSERLLPNLRRAYAEERGAAPGAPLDIGALFAEMIEFHGRLPTCRA
ncbi:MBL fold metallo-hydrolase [Streptomyces sp. NPDC050538]|uniref:MBL fold metallo-hydrolase n=1 Tax=Streptomyces sp. NPDC050538 TaxID=3365627 RepID=UPI00378D2A26